jgi:hypothetical protein
MLPPAGADTIMVFLKVRTFYAKLSHAALLKSTGVALG